ncbi:hypothetical protein EON65_39430 [archaeon]|nr:MAG: hypothetical protein EON65_39430 [archaeon]
MNVIRSYWKTVVLVVFYVAHLWVFYGIVLYHLGGKVAEKCHGTWGCKRRLSEGLLKYPIDLSDGQYREFRHHLRLFIVIGIVSVLVDKGYRLVLGILYPNNKILSASQLIYPKLIVGVIAVLVQHKYHSLIVFAIGLIGYYIPRISKNIYISTSLVWIYALSILALKESYRLLPYYNIPILGVMFNSQYGGLYRWHLPANFLVLRLLSFGIDHINARHILTATKKDDDQASSNTGTKQIAYAEFSEYNNVYTYLAYLLYLPLYMAGPIVTYTNFVKCVQSPQQSVNPYTYTIRLAVCWVLMEVLLTKLPLFAVLSSPLFPHLNVYEIATVCYLLLKLMWLKFLLIWRFFRAWALFDGVYTEENMVRCMSNNYSLEQFWKGWHASFNKFLVQYIYLPLGGRKYRILSACLIFFFVALWHDFEVHLLVWGGLNTCFYAIEVLCKPVTGYHTKQQLKGMSFMQNLLSSLSSAVYILILMGVNLTGYSVGTGGASIILNKFYTMDGLYVLLFALYILFIGVNMMFSLQKWGWVKDF